MRDVTEEFQTYYLTKQGKNRLLKEASRIQKRLREISLHLKSIRQEINLRESGDWEVISSQYRQYEDRLQHINHILRNTVLIKKNGTPEEVQLGSKVCLQNDGRELCYTLVDSFEANPFEGKISIKSQIGRALLGKRVYDTIKVIVPKGGTILYKILHIS